MRQRLFTILSAASLFMCLVVALLGMRDPTVCDRFGYCSETPDARKRVFTGVAFWRARLILQLSRVEYLRRDSAPPSRAGWCAESYDRPQPDRFPYLPSNVASLFAYGSEPRPPSFSRGTGTLNSIFVPTWLAAALLGLPSLLWLRRSVFLWRRRMRGLCQICGYDLRASKDRCPECGSAIPDKAT